VEQDRRSKERPGPGWSMGEQGKHQGGGMYVSFYNQVKGNKEIARRTGPPSGGVGREKKKAVR